MKTHGRPNGATRGARAMTLIELMTTTGLFTLVVAGMVAVNMFGLKQDELANSKLGASDETRENFNLLLDEIRSGKNVQIGSGSWTNFTPITNGAQQGDTLQIIESTNTGWTNFYYFTSNTPPGEKPVNNNWLVRVAMYGNGLTNITNVVARNIYNVSNAWLTNALNFSALGFNGTNWVMLTNDPTTYSTHNYIVNCLLQFYQYQYPLTMVGTNYLYDYYQLNLQATRRAP